MRNFAGIEDRFCKEDFAKVFLQSVPYDGTSTWGKGADKGFEKFLDALENMELYDIETHTEVYQNGVHILPPLINFNTPESMFNEVYKTTKTLLEKDKFLTFFGGEHSISIGIIKAFYEKFRNLSVLHIDAHADLRPTYLGSPYNHACALHDASKNCNLVQVGVRSMDVEEVEYMKKNKVYFAEKIHGKTQWMIDSVNQLSNDVYITFDLDAFDPSIMPSTGTPEPGGLLWNDITKYLKMVFESKNVVGIDIVELAPIDGLTHPDFLVASRSYEYC